MNFYLTKIETAYDVVRLIFVILDILLFFGIIAVIKKFWKYRPKFSVKPPKEKIIVLKGAIFRDRWQSVMNKIEIGSSESMRIAVIEADSIIDSILKEAGVPGKHMADRLMNVDPNSLSSLNKLWIAHKFRNELVHNPNFSPPKEEIMKTIDNYKAFLNEIGII